MLGKTFYLFQHFPSADDMKEKAIREGMGFAIPRLLICRESHR